MLAVGVVVEKVTSWLLALWEIFRGSGGVPSNNKILTFGHKQSPSILKINLSERVEFP